MSTAGCTAGSAEGIAAMRCQVSACPTTSGRCACSASSEAHRANDVPGAGSTSCWPPRCWAQARLRSSSRIRHDTPSTARWWTIATRRPVEATHSALSITPAAGFNRDRASIRASSESTCTACRQCRASTDPGSGTCNDHAPSAPSSTRSRSIACRSNRACSTTTTSASVVPTGACTTTVWLNWSTGPSMLCSQEMIGVGTTGPTPSSIASAAPSTTAATRASRATVCSTKMSRGRHTTPAARARATTCIDRMLSPPSSKNDSSTPTRSSPSTCA
ncbi:hypothetical protein AWC20_20210 [Mycobacterium parmense]|nr:hypothetical protein AWC20_20210 [Mycobacterium parmense]